MLVGLGVTRTSDPRTKRASAALARLYDAVNEATLVPRAKISPTMITPPAVAHERRRTLLVSRPWSGRPKRGGAGAGRCAKQRSTALARSSTPPIQTPIGTTTRCSWSDTDRP